MRTLSLALVLSFALAACSSSTPSGAPDGKAAAPGAAAPEKAAAGRVIQLTKLGLKGTAVGETEEPMIGTGDPMMISGATFTLNVSEAKATDPKTLKDEEAIAKGFNGKNIKSETLPDGWLMTYQNTGSMGENYFVSIRRTIGGKAYLCETTQNTPEQEKASVAFCKSLSK
jgi:hypothetical protein